MLSSTEFQFGPIVRQREGLLHLNVVNNNNGISQFNTQHTESDDFVKKKFVKSLLARSEFGNFYFRFLFLS